MNTIKNSAFAAIFACVWLFTTIAALSQSDRVVIIEQFTSATSQSALAPEPLLARVVDIEKGIVSIRYHVDFPESDPFNSANKPDNRTRKQYYNVSTIPVARVNGNRETDLRDELEVLQIAASELAKETPVTLSVSQTPVGGGRMRVDVTAMSSASLNGYKLRVAVLQRRVELPNLPDELALSNGQTVFYDPMMFMLPNAEGSEFSIGAGGSEEFDFEYTLGSGELWPTNQQYVVAFIQDDATKEILVAASDLRQISTRNGLTSKRPFASFLSVGRNDQQTQQVYIHNRSNQSVQAMLAIDGTASIIPPGWNVQIEPLSTTIGPQDSVAATVTLTAPGRAGYAQALATVSTQNEDLFETSFYVGCLSEGTKYVIYDGFNGSAYNSYFLPLRDQTQFAGDAAFLPFNNAVLQAYPPEEFEAIVLPMGDNHIQRSVIEAIDKARNAGKGIVLAANEALWWAFDEAPEAAEGKIPEVQDFFRETLDIEYVERKSRFDGSDPIPFSITGVLGDELGDGLQLDANTSIQNPIQNTDIFKLGVGGANVSPVLFYDGNEQELAAAKVVDNMARIVYLSFGTEALQDADAQKLLLDKTLEWVTSEPVSVRSNNVYRQELFTLTAYPNPFVREFHIECEYEGVIPSQVSLSICDMRGVEVLPLHHGVLSRGVRIYRVDSLPIASGRYFVVLRTPEETLAIPIVKAE